MAKTLDISKPNTITAKGREVNASRVGKEIFVGSDRSIYQDRRWVRLRALLIEPTCRYCSANPSCILDHWTPVSMCKDPLDPYNLVSSCRDCHLKLSATYDAVGGVYRNVRSGKPDPRDAKFYERVRIMVETGMVAKALTVVRRKTKERTATLYAMTARVYGC